MNISEYITPVSGLEYYVCMVDHGHKIGMGADVAPEYSRSNIVETVRDKIASGRTIVHVKHIVGNDMQDVTEEIIRDALDEDFNPGLITVSDLIEARRDHARDLRKHSQAAE